MIVTVELQTLTVAFPVQISRDQTSLDHQNLWASDEQQKLTPVIKIKISKVVSHLASMTCTMILTPGGIV